MSSSSSNFHQLWVLKHQVGRGRRRREEEEGGLAVDLFPIELFTVAPFINSSCLQLLLFTIQPQELFTNMSFVKTELEEHGDALDRQQDSKAQVGEEEDVEGVMSSLHASAPDQEAILAISIIPATESKCEAVVSCGAPPKAPQHTLTKWEEGGKDDNSSRAAAVTKDPAAGRGIVLNAEALKTNLLPKHAPRWSSMTVETFTVQCFECMKWRIIPTKEQYEMIGEKILEQPWVCEDAQAWRHDATCEDPPDLSEDEPSILWAVDRHSIPCAPDGFYRKIVIRGERSAKFADVYYKTPCGKTLRSMVDVQRYLDDQPKFAEAGVNRSQFSFAPPKPGPGFRSKAPMLLEGPKRKKKACMQLSIVSKVAPAHKKQICYPQPLAIMDPQSEPGQLSPGKAEASPLAPSCEDKQCLEGGQSHVSSPSTDTHLPSVKTEAIGAMKP
ncbi:hypothetical protein CY35_04G012700 [Sphagnum magellanicum]|nr:hypothetical protein CY35_04G012700 [Sphagnum magellanicum]